MKTLLRALLGGTALAMSFGCADVAQVLLASGVPSPGATTAPAANASTAPVANATAAPTPRPSTAAATPKPAAGGGTNVGASGPETCTRVKDDSDKDNGTANLGAYSNQYMPLGWIASYGTEAEVTGAIDQIYLKGTDWNCFQKFYPGATTVWMRNTGLSI